MRAAGLQSKGGPMIRQLSEQVAEDLCAQQVITSICDCIKELVDNSIDAGATRVEVYLEDYGKQRLRVTDNGCGIGSFEFLAKKGSTSKNKGNLAEVNTLGFRGEALHSLGKVSLKMVIVSAVLGHKTIAYDVKAQTQSQVYPGREQGTIVQIQGLFQFLPVRRYQLLNKHKQFLKKTDEMVKEYCLISPHISFVLRNLREGREDLLIEASIARADQLPGEAWRDRVSQMLGPKISAGLIYVQAELVRGWLMNNIESGSSRDNSHVRRNLHYMYLNGRPIDPLTKIVGFLDSCYKKYNKSTKYVFVLNLVLPSSSYDLNLTPNKREILIKEALVLKLIEQLKSFIDKNVVEEIPTLQNHEDRQSKERMSNFVDRKPEKASSVVEKCCQGQHSKTEHDPPMPDINKRKSGAPTAEVMVQAHKEKEKNIRQIRQEMKQQNRDHVGSKKPVFQHRKSTLLSSLNEVMSKGRASGLEKRQKDIGLIRIKNKQSQVQPLKQNNLERLHQRIETPKPSTFYTKVDGQNQAHAPKIVQQTEKTLKPATKDQYKQSNCLADKPEVDKTDHNIEKSNFTRFHVLGQFNHGFIVCLFQGKYYLIDQHAASEKSHFEKLLKQPRNRSQVSEVLTLNAIEAQNVKQNQQKLQQEGFRFTDLEDGTILLTEAPIFLGKTYGKQYMLELAASQSQLREHSDYYNAAATKACRSAVMVGDVLQPTQMRAIVGELASLDSPWNCPHGRPTLIYLGAVGQIHSAVAAIRSYDLE